MNQEQVIAQIVSSYREEPRNKIIIDASPLVCYASEEIGSPVSAAQLAEALIRFEDGEASEEDQDLVDAATSLCHQVANRCWGECESEEDDEWTEVDISTEWSDYDSDNPEEMFVTIYQD